MGMYTELIFGAALQKDLPDEILGMLEWLMDPQEGKLTRLLPHPLFSTERYSMVIRGAGGSFPAWSRPILEYDNAWRRWKFSFRSHFKNYDGEAQAFIDWIYPYVVDGGGPYNLFATTQYEADAVPTLYFMSDEECGPKLDKPFVVAPTEPTPPGAKG